VEIEQALSDIAGLSFASVLRDGDADHRLSSQENAEWQWFYSSLWSTYQKATHEAHWSMTPIMLTVVSFAIEAAADPLLMHFIPRALPDAAALAGKFSATLFMSVYTTFSITVGGYVTA
jgi:hypothetical protein